MHSILKNHMRWLFPVILILFILEIFTLPLVLELTYAGRSEAPNHVLTYTPGKLRWDDATGVDPDGSAILSLFDSQYGDTVRAGDGDQVIAPGTDGFNIVRLKNSAEKPVNYTAVLYKIQDNPELPVKAELSGNGFTDTETHSLPEKVSNAEVIRSVTGEVGSGEIQDFDINWLWKYDEDETQDIIDTLLGDKAAYAQANDVTVGLYIVVEDNNESITPGHPKTGDTGIGMYVALIILSGAVLILLVATRRKEKRCEG